MHNILPNKQQQQIPRSHTPDRKGSEQKEKSRPDDYKNHSPENVTVKLS